MLAEYLDHPAIVAEQSRSSPYSAKMVENIHHYFLIFLMMHLVVTYFLSLIFLKTSWIIGCGQVSNPIRPGWRGRMLVS